MPSLLINLDTRKTNDNLLTLITEAIQAEPEVGLLLKLDDNPEETSWEVLDTEGSVVASGGPYTEANTLIIETLDLENGCYHFILYDTGGNGLGNGNGNFLLYYGSSNVIISAKIFGEKAEEQFSIDYGVGIEENNFEAEIKLYPNPSNGNTTLNLTANDNTSVNVSIFTMTGKIAFKNNFEVTKGENNINLSQANLSEGIYLVKVKVGDKLFTERISILK